MPAEREQAAEVTSSGAYEGLIDVIRRRRSVRKFEKGRAVPREVLEKILEAGRWAPSGANAQPWDFVCVDNPATRERVRAVFLEQGHRLRARVPGFPAVDKRYLEHTVAIVLVLGDERWKKAFPQSPDPSFAREYADNNESIFFCSLGAAIQNIQLAIASLGLTSAWLSGGGEDETASALREVLGFPPAMRPFGTIPIGFPAKDVASRYRRPLGQVVHWNSYDPRRFRPDALVDYYVERLRPFAMYRGSEHMEVWEDFEERAGPWASAFTGDTPNPTGELPKT